MNFMARSGYAVINSGAEMFPLFFLKLDELEKGLRCRILGGFGE